MNATTKKMLCTAVLGCGTVMLSNVAHAAVTDADKSFLTMAAQSDINEIKLSELASTKATDPKVKAFAQKMVTDHTMLETKMKPFADQWGLTPPSGPDSDHQAELDKLNGLSGADFDKEYMMAMDKDHHMALDAFKNEKSTTTDSKFKMAVSNGEKVVAEHTKMADKMSGKSGMTSMSGM
jgi:putative membrane protein